MYIVCELCQSTNSKWSAKNHDAYLEHLVSSEHQKKAMAKFTYAWENSSFQELFTIADESRCLVVRGSYPLVEFEKQKCLLEDFNEFGIIHDFVLLRKTPKFICAIIFDSPVEVRNVMFRFKKTINESEIEFTPWKGDDWVMLRKEIQLPEIESGFPNIPKLNFSAIPLPKAKVVRSKPTEQSFSHILTTSGIAVNFSREITFEDILESVKLSVQEISKRNHILEELHSFFLRQFPNCRLYIFGSMVTEIGCTKSPLDISVHPEGSPELNKFIVVNKVCNMLRTKNVTSQDKPFLDIRQKQEHTTSVVTFYHRIAGIQCKIFINHIVALKSSELISFYFNFDPRCRPFALFIHHWAKVYNLLQKCKLSRYGLNLMICAYLSHKNIIPSVFVLQQLNAQNDKTELHRSKKWEWDISFCSDVTAIRTYMSQNGYIYPTERDLSFETILLLAKSFFEFYLDADLSRHIVCCYMAKCIPKKAFDDGQEHLLPPMLFRYQRWASTAKKIVKRKSMFNSIDCLAIQDPFNHVVNITKGTNKKSVVFLEEAAKVGLMGVNHFLSNSELNGNNIDNLFAPLVPGRNRDDTPVLIETPKYLDDKVQVQLASELNSMLFVAYPFLNTTNCSKLLLFTPCKLFRQIFMQFFYTFTSKSVLKKLMSYVWINFAQDFVVDYLTNCYFFRLQQRNLTESEMRKAEVPHNSSVRATTQRKTFKNFRSEFEENRSSESDDETDKEGFDGLDEEIDYNESELQQDLIDLENIAKCRRHHLGAKMNNLLDVYNTWGEMEIRRIYACECADPIWDNRETFRAQLRNKGPNGASSVTHPLTVETMLSSMVKETNEKYQKGKEYMRLYCAYKIFVWKDIQQGVWPVEEKSVPILLVSLKSEKDHFSRVNLNHLTSHIQELFAQYSKYKLKGWISE